MLKYLGLHKKRISKEEVCDTYKMSLMLIQRGKTKKTEYALRRKLNKLIFYVPYSFTIYMQRNIALKVLAFLS